MAKLKLIVVLGHLGTGKTSVAKEIAKVIDAQLIRTDVIRREMFKVRKYTQEESDRVFSEIFKRGEKLLKKNRSVVLDAVFAKKSERQQAKDIADRTKAEFQITEVTCPESLIKERVEARRGDESEGRFEHYLFLKKFFEPITKKHIVIDNSGPFEKTKQQIRKHFG